MTLASVSKAQVHVCAPTPMIQDNHASHNSHSLEDSHATHSNGSHSNGSHSNENPHSQHSADSSHTPISDSEAMSDHNMPCCDPATIASSVLQNHNPCGDCDMQPCSSSSAVMPLTLLSLSQTTESRVVSQFIHRPPAPIKEWLIPPIK
ncbi:hypothetical protein FE810_08580 [Thalassotalea litorea]|uniref:Uncharacterized protein n=1 Tax=Thalassotalea litorea TaxID=2020715 RepID=A0A5R9IJ60_9GAMM|nr:hypothetical protein [Thalassotalea litorea]TLU65332.1 hypothetical protein FE810_08580 [Thalassotalea litorea]